MDLHSRLEAFRRALLEFKVDFRGEPLSGPAFEGMFLSLVACESVRSGKNKVYLIGNGGSAAVASHVMVDLVRKGLGAFTLLEPSVLTCLSNDIGFDSSFSEQIKVQGKPGDVLIAISSSGESKDILNAVKMAKRLDMLVVTFSGFEPDNFLRSMGDLNVCVASTEYGVVESAHAAILHALIDGVLKGR